MLSLSLSLPCVVPLAFSVLVRSIDPLCVLQIEFFLERKWFSERRPIEKRTRVEFVKITGWKPERGRMVNCANLRAWQGIFTCNENSCISRWSIVEFSPSSSSFSFFFFLFTQLFKRNLVQYRQRSKFYAMFFLSLAVGSLLLEIWSKWHGGRACFSHVYKCI